MRSLVSWLGTDSSFFLLYGPAGSGKTSLALEVARHAIQDVDGRFTAAVWLPARPAIHTADGFLQLPLACGDLEAFIVNICATIGRQDILKELPETQPALVRSALSEQRVLLLADDLDEVADPRVLPFLSALPEGTAILATSRRELDVQSRFRVQPLGRSDSALLVDSLLNGNQEHPGYPDELTSGEFDELYEITGGIPLALVWATSLVRVGEPIADIVKQFTNSDSDILKFCFRTAWRQIEHEPASQVLGALTLLNDGARRQLLADACGLPADSHRYSKALVLLRRLGLVENSTERLALLPMTRSFVVANIFGEPPDPRSETLREQWADALARYVGNSLRAEEVSSCFAQLETERPNLEELLTWASTQDETYGRARAATVYHDLSYFFFSRGYWSILSGNAEWAIPELWKQALYEEAIGVLLTWVARVFLLRDDQSGLQNCFDFANNLISAAPRDQAPLLRAIFDFNAASIRQREGDDPLSVELLRSAAEEFERSERAEWLVRTLNRLGNVLSARGEYAEARTTYEAAISAGTSIEETAVGREIVAIARGNRGILANRQGDSETAKALLHEVESLIDQTMDGATLLMELAIAEYRSGREEEAYRLGTEAQEKAKDLQVGITLAESDSTWEREVLPQLATRYGREGTR